MNIRRWLAAGLVLTVLATCVAYVVSQLERKALASQTGAANVATLLAARSALQTNVLTARAGLELSFDDVNEALLALRSVNAQAARARALGLGLGRDYQRSAQELTQAADALRIEESAIETFKTDMALLRVSSQYFPVVAEALARRANAGTVEALSSLRTDVERYEAAPTRELAKRLEAAILAISAARTAWADDDASSAELSVLLGHTRVILDRRERVDAFARNFVRSPVRLHLEAAQAAYEHATRKPLTAAAALRLVASVFAALGLLAFASAAWRSIRRVPRLGY